jgi:hypothetical protein
MIISAAKLPASTPAMVHVASPHAMLTEPALRTLTALRDVALRTVGVVNVTRSMQVRLVSVSLAMILAPALVKRLVTLSEAG